jgi:homoserine kinase type II
MEGQLERVLRSYSLGRLSTASRAAQGFVNENWILVTSQGRFFLKRRAPHLCLPDLIRAQHHLIRWLRQAGFPAPAIVPTITGETFLALDGELYDVQVYIDGQPYNHDRASHLRAAALTLGRYHKLVRGFAAEPLCSPGELYSPDILSAILASLTDAWEVESDDELADHSRQLRTHLTSLEARFSQHGPLPRLVIHGDYYADNLIFADDTIVGVVDYDKARRQPRVAELAEALIYFASPLPGDFKHLVYPGVLRWEPLMRFLRSYASASGLDEEEIRALPDYVRCIWLSMSLKRLLEQGPRPAEAPEALQEVIALGDWADANASRMIEACRSAMLG